jgi:hypothetical protein
VIKIVCSRKEKELIREVIDVQLDNLKKLLSGDAPVDLKLHCIQNEIEIDELNKLFIKNLVRFQKVKDDPNTLFSLDEENLSIFRHILCHYQRRVKGYKKTRAKIWRKIFHYEKLFTEFQTNMN